VIERGRALAELTAGPFDVVVIGGGVTGAGVALDAASRGYSTAIVERHDWAIGTSSRSSKMVHGGLRYLQNFDLGLVREALLERQLLVRLAEDRQHEPDVIGLAVVEQVCGARVASGERRDEVDDLLSGDRPMAVR
jgi:glycerol-3-phosphate dehydrogenase